MTQETTLAALRTHVAPVEVGFSTSDSYGLMKKIALDFAGSSLVPQRYQKSAPDCMIALNMALRMRADPLMVMQNLYVVHGTPAWSASFLIACFNQCGRFGPIAYTFEGKRDSDEWGCRAVSSYLADGTPIEGPLVTIGMAKAEGWYGKAGSKWKTMAEQMLRYRAASWMIRSTAPEISMGFYTREEVIDMGCGEDGVFEASIDTISHKTAAPRVSQTGKESENAQPAETPASEDGEKAGRQADNKERAAQLAALAKLREETMAAWESTGAPLDEAEKLVNAFAAKWNTAQCQRIMAEVQKRQQNPVQPAEQAAPSSPGQEELTVSCPRKEGNKDGDKVSEEDCFYCQSRQGCPAWETE